MSNTVIQVSKQELTQLISNAAEQKLVELFGDPDEGSSMKEIVRKRLLQQRRNVAKGDRGVDLKSVRKQLGL